MMFLESNRDFLTKYIRGDKNITDHQGILEQYDYVFVTERFDESLVLFSLTFGIPLRTLQYSSQLKNRQGIRPTASMKPDWLNNYTMYFYPNDLILWELANSKLDAQKAAIAERCGGHVVEDTLQNFKYLQGS